MAAATAPFPSSSAESRDALVAFGGALVVHAFAAWLAVSTLTLPTRDAESAPPVEIIEAEIIDARVLEAEAQRLRDREAAERRAVEQAAADAEAKRLDAVRAVAELEAADRRAREAAAAKARADEEAKAREAAKAKRDAAAQTQREKELKAQVATEERRRKAEQSGAMAQYTSAIQQKVIRNWIKPALLPAGLECLVRVEQLPTGDVVRVTVLTCNGDAAVRRSIEDAVLKASPLPTPNDRSLYSRVLEFNFKPTTK